MWLALHLYVASQPRDSSETFQLTRVSWKVSDESLGRDETYVCKASHIYWFILQYVEQEGQEWVSKIYFDRSTTWPIVL